jgi:energy-coupling factor transport system ATP-binding protein
MSAGLAGAAGAGAAGAGAAGAGDALVSVRDAFCLHPVPGGAVAALRGLTLTVAAGERVVIQGPNGSGKTTLLRVLAGEQALSAGQARVAGLEVGSRAVGGRQAWRQAAARAAWRVRRLGWVDQQPGRTLRPELDVMANVTLQSRLAGVAGTQAQSAAVEMLARLGVEALARRDVTTLSGGEAQRVAVAAALAHRPQLVLADEPTGELDAEAALAVYDALTDLCLLVGASLVLVSHDRRAERVADRALRIRDGRLSETWTTSTRAVREAGSERLVVDDRGWLRLPEALRIAAGATSEVTAALVDGAVVLTGADAPTPSSPDGAAANVAANVAARAGVVAPQPDSVNPKITSDDLSATTLAELRAVDLAPAGFALASGVGLTLRAGMLLVVRGPSGSGKTSLLRVLLGLERPASGSVSMVGVDLAGLDRRGLADLRRRHCAVSGQQTHLAETLHAAGNLALARTVRGLPPEAGLVDELLHRLGLAAAVGRPVRVLSGGERQRVALGRVMVVRPQLAVLDEPTSQLDEAGAESITAVLRALADRGVGVVVASHDPAIVAAADEVLDLGADVAR